MHYVSVENLSKSYGTKPLFKQISFHISEGDKIAFIAKNGSGKSTLLKILAAKEHADSGTVWIHKDVSIALFEQEPVFEETKSVIDNIFNFNHPSIEIIKAYELACEAEDADAISNAIEKMDELNAWDFDTKVKQILGKLRIHNYDQLVSTLSGGQRKRVALAQTLINIGFEHKHVLLIMDEPTNHLDVEMIEWLEHYLNQEKVTLLLVSHDRYFLDAVCEEIWELDESELFVYKGDYENYIEKKAARIENQAASIDKAKNTYRKELEWMRKQPKARTTKSKSREDNFYEVEAKAKQKIIDEKVQLEMKMSRLGGKVAEFKKVYKSFGEKKILTGFDYTFKRGERVGIVGQNGTGKSTFLQMLQNLEPADSGKINIGETIVFGNFSQQGLEIKEDMRVIEYVKNIAENFPLAKGGSLSAAQFLQLFLFSPDQQYTYISKLSGGEKKRLQLLAVLFKNPNFLILDEPTNDLDLATLNVLENFLMDYQGCLLLVSHDRYFMDKLVDHLFVFEGEGVVNDFPGNYTSYRIHLKEKQTQQKTSINTTLMTNDSSKVIDPIPSTIEEPLKKEKKKLSYNEQRLYENLEKDIAQLEDEKIALTNQLSTLMDYEALQKASNRILEIGKVLEEKEMKWLELSERI
ncbi:MAG: ABC-F family ATP-binding cassette domain-containing protein [Bacteroidota bacterium]|nr:ABC-F family ATP-binding cassette domain-containing protein [Bacteroidota bacterium]